MDINPTCRAVSIVFSKAAAETCILGSTIILVKLQRNAQGTASACNSFKERQKYGDPGKKAGP